VPVAVIPLADEIVDAEETEAMALPSPIPRTVPGLDVRAIPLTDAVRDSVPLEVIVAAEIVPLALLTVTLGDCTPDAETLPGVVLNATPETVALPVPLAETLPNADVVVTLETVAVALITPASSKSPDAESNKPYPSSNNIVMR